MTTEDEKVHEEKPEKKPMVRQYLVAGAPPGSKRIRKGAAVLSTCPKLATAEFRRMFPELEVWSTSQIAETDMTKDDAEGRDFWKEGANYVMFDWPEEGPPKETFFGKAEA